PSGYTQYSPANQGGDNAKDSNGPGTGGNCTTAIVPEGTTDMTLDFGFFKLGALGDFVWADGNSNGVQNTGEVGINNVGLKLTGPGGDRTAVTAGGGLYLFDNLRPGTYTVCVPTMPVGFTGTSAAFQGGDATKDSNGSGGASNCATVTLTSGQTDLTIDFGFTKAAVVLGSIGDFVWHDKNGNGVQEAGEEGIGGAVVKITGPNGYASQMNTTAQGNYLFTGLAAGTYVVCVAMPSGYTGITGAGLGGDATKDSNGNGTTTNCSANVVLASGASDLTIDFGFYKLGSIGDYTWYDKNDNGIQNSGEPAFNGVKVTLSGTASGTQTTANGGKYLFTGLKPGTYTVCATVPGGYHAVTANVGNDRAIDSNGEGAQNCSTVVLASGENNLTVDFGFDCGKASPTLASVGDFVWFDKNSNGVQDSGEAGIKNVTVKLTGPNGVSKTTTTNAYGKYLFSDLQPGTYTICVPSVSGYFPTGADKGGYDNKDSDGTGAGNCASVTLTAGEQDLTIDFGFDCKPVSASLQGYVWNDTDKDGIQDGNESGIKGRTVTLSINGTTKTTTTDSYGKYYFTNLNPGIYTVCTAVPTGYVQSPSNVGSNEGVDSDGTGANNCATVTLAAGENKIDPDFGIYCKPTTGAIGSYVWNDENKNGIQDSGEKGISGRTVTLTGAANRTTTTDSYGKYSFTGLNAGTYTVCVAAPSGYQATAADKGDDAVDSDGKPTTQGNCATITLAAGQTNNNIDFGFYCVPVSAKIGGQVWYDKNYNGVQDGGYEVGMGSKTVKISGPGGTKTATTANDGSYSFGNLAAGTYSVCGAIPSGYKASPANKTTSAKDSDGAGSYNCASVTISAGQTITTIDFGFDKKY
ncbi:MAG: SdrD B-like domain-containing protein, partial [Gemmatimonas sp.]